MMWIFLSVLVLVLGGLYAQNRYYVHQKRREAEDLEFIKGQIGATQRAVKKLEDMLAQVMVGRGGGRVPIARSE
jgi:hypothetical protein